MTTAEQLWNDEKFVLRRFEEQGVLLQKYIERKDWPYPERAVEVMNSCYFILERFFCRYIELITQRECNT